MSTDVVALEVGAPLRTAAEVMRYEGVGLGRRDRRRACHRHRHRPGRRDPCPGRGPRPCRNNARLHLQQPGLERGPGGARSTTWFDWCATGRSAGLWSPSRETAPSVSCPWATWPAGAIRAWCWPASRGRRPMRRDLWSGCRLPPEALRPTPDAKRPSADRRKRGGIPTVGARCLWTTVPAPAGLKPHPRRQSPTAGPGAPRSVATVRSSGSSVRRSDEGWAVTTSWPGPDQSRARPRTSRSTTFSPSSDEAATTPSVTTTRGVLSASSAASHGWQAVVWVRFGRWWMRRLPRGSHLKCLTALVR